MCLLIRDVSDCNVLYLLFEMKLLELVLLVLEIRQSPEVPTTINEVGHQKPDKISHIGRGIHMLTHGDSTM
jgi:hypothetical protein